MKGISEFPSRTFQEFFVIFDNEWLNYVTSQIYITLQKEVKE